MWSVVSSCSSWYGFLGSLEEAQVEVLCHHVHVSALDGDVLGESAGSVFNEGPNWPSFSFTVEK